MAFFLPGSLTLRLPEDVTPDIPYYQAFLCCSPVLVLIWKDYLGLGNVAKLWTFSIQGGRGGIKGVRKVSIALWHFLVEGLPKQTLCRKFSFDPRINVSAEQTKLYIILTLEQNTIPMGEMRWGKTIQLKTELTWWSAGDGSEETWCARASSSPPPSPPPTHWPTPPCSTPSSTQILHPYLAGNCQLLNIHSFGVQQPEDFKESFFGWPSLQQSSSITPCSRCSIFLSFILSHSKPM